MKAKKVKKITFNKKELTFEIQLSKIVQNEEERRSNKEISDFIANMY